MGNSKEIITDPEVAVTTLEASFRNMSLFWHTQLHSRHTNSWQECGYGVCSDDRDSLEQFKEVDSVEEQLTTLRSAFQRKLEFWHIQEHSRKESVDGCGFSTCADYINVLKSINC